MVHAPYIGKDIKASIMVAAVAVAVTILTGLEAYHVRFNMNQKVMSGYSIATANNRPAIKQSNAEGSLCLILKKAVADFPNGFNHIKGKYIGSSSSSDRFAITDLPDGFEGTIESPRQDQDGETVFRLQVYSNEELKDALQWIIRCQNALVQDSNGFTDHLNANSVKGQRLYHAEDFVKGPIKFELRGWGPFYGLEKPTGSGRYYVSLYCSIDPR